MKARCWPSWQVILDWYHLEKRYRENLSLALKGRLIRKQVLGTLIGVVVGWARRWRTGISSGAGVSTDQEWAELAKLISYLQRHRPHIPCYSVRKQLGLRNSSDRGEKENALVVATRQKHNGMSW